jgi:aryl-alcohol dehydrogenase-like predicted oxidoreductase
MVDLPTRQFGRTDMTITRVGFGAWAIGGPDWAFGWGSQDDADSIAAIRHAVDSGINWIDTASAYGLGHSEELVGQAVSTYSDADRPYVFTKCGMVWDPADRSKRPDRIASPESLRRDVEDSLRRLNVERIDLMQLHWPPNDGTPVEVYWQALSDLRAEGKLRAVGLSNHSVAQLEIAEKIGHVDSLQPPFSAINRAVGDAELPWCADHGTGVIVYSPMQSGLLTGAFTKERAAALGPDDWRSRDANFTDKLDANLALADALGPIAERHDTSVASIAIAWTLAWPGVTGAIVGARRPDQVDGWIDAAGITLTDDDLAEVAAAIEGTGAGDGPTRP